MNWPYVLISHDNQICHDLRTGGLLLFCQERPFNLFMGGGRFKSKAPMLSWYRNPQFRVSMRQPQAQAPLQSEDGINQNAEKYGQYYSLSLFYIWIHTIWIIIIHYLIIE